MSACPQKVAIYCYEDDALAHRKPRHSGPCASSRKANVVGTVTLQAVYTLENLSTPSIQRQVAAWRLAHQSFKLDGTYIVWEVAGMEALDPTLSLESQAFKGVAAQLAKIESRKRSTTCRVIGCKPVALALNPLNR